MFGDEKPIAIFHRYKTTKRFSLSLFDQVFRNAIHHACVRVCMCACLCVFCVGIYFTDIVETEGIWSELKVALMGKGSEATSVNLKN